MLTASLGRCVGIDSWDILNPSQRAFSFKSSNYSLSNYSPFGAINLQPNAIFFNAPSAFHPAQISG